jgi:hypothetical protein
VSPCDGQLATAGEGHSVEAQARRITINPWMLVIFEVMG